MDRFTSWLRGRVRLRITAAEPGAFLNACAAAGLTFWDARAENACTLTVSVSPGELTWAVMLADRCGCESEVLSERGVPRHLRRMKHRAGWLAAILLLACVLLASSLFVWEIGVEENETPVPSAEILRVLEEQGVGPGSFWPGFSSERIRSRALSELPGLSWLTVNVRGSRARVIVRAERPVPEIWDPGKYADVEAAVGGVITECRVLEGESLVRVGDAVSTGDTLVSGERSGGTAAVRHVHARAEITARTRRELTAICPLEETETLPAEGKKVRLSLLLGKRRINFFGGSGILPPDCDKITKIRKLAIRNVFSLPAALVTERWERHGTAERSVDTDLRTAELTELLEQELRRRLGDRGEILSLRTEASALRGRLVVTLRAECSERIDREVLREE